MAATIAAQIAPVVAARAADRDNTAAFVKGLIHKRYRQGGLVQGLPKTGVKGGVQFQWGKGFASSKGNKKANKKVNLDTKKDLPKGWENAGNIADFEANPNKPFISPYTGEAFMLFKFEEKVYCTEANSTAFKYPLVDAEIFAGEDGPVIKVPLDGTSYNLSTGEVIEWCPTDNFVRGFLGKLKQKTAPIPLKVFETKVSTDGTVIFKGLRD
eukprot:CAMPEP_0118933428 /NCGR_PEP_ID=MMETSP1169-20130426/11984_1 /TAXON_ID=36882 /ORGANISM="Pyramimonas obovata, Strain CCMP722" /LENGTH=211 /DNA_ID=CAMNT_0006876185 /DNA_START=101 /DNA_END=736 /DNA_ORIENTATION=+